MLVYLAFFCGFGLFLSIAAYCYLKYREAGEDSLVVPPQIAEDLEELRHEVNSITEVVKLLEQFNGDYFSTLLHSGFKELCEIAEILTEVLKVCDQLVLKNKFEETKEILDFVVEKDGFGVAAPSIIKFCPAAKTKLKSWRDQVQSHIDLIDENLSQRSEEFQKIGRIRSTKRNATSTILEEVRKVIVQHTAQKVKPKDYKS